MADDTRDSEGGSPTTAAPPSDPQSADLADPSSSAPHPRRGLWTLTLGSVGVVYGDIGTSPIYALRESLHATASGGREPADVMGVISLLIWALTLIVALKYVVLVLRADNQGEGGTLSLVALVQRGLARRPAWLLALGMVGISLFFGDAMITPAISVLSAVEGVSLVAPTLSAYVVPLTLVIIVALFFVQRWGTGTVSAFFGPITAVWFLTMAVLGLSHIGDNPVILWALNPGAALGFLLANGWASLIVLGSIFLAVTGAEALYADLGHFGKRPIRLAWVGLVWPALTLSYLGQGALVLADPTKAGNPFFLMVPEGLLLPVVLLATLATVIASQAVISGAFSMVKQAARIGLVPRFEILHTSESQEGQIYLPKVNLILAVGVVILVLLFGSSSSLAGAYGIAVSGDMVITTMLVALVLLRSWHWPWPVVAAVMLPIAVVEAVFLGANVLKIPDGGWAPILFAAALVLLMWTWLRGTQHVRAQSRRRAVPLGTLIEQLAGSERLKAVSGLAVFLTSDPDMAPDALLHNIKHNQVLHERNMIVSVAVTTQPHVPEAERLVIERLSDHFTRVDMRFGYMEEANVPKALALARKQGERFDIMSTSFFLNRRIFRVSKTQGLPAWQASLFVSLSKSAANATDFYRLPTGRVVELGQQIII